MRQALWATGGVITASGSIPAHREPQSLSRLKWSIVIFGALIAGALVAFALSTLGLAVDDRIMLALGFPIAIVLAGTTAVVVASRISNALVRDGTRTHLPRGLIRSLQWTLPAAVLTALLLPIRGLLGGLPLGMVILPAAIIACAGASIMAVRSREGEGNRRRDLYWSLGVLALVPAAFFGVMAAACAVDMCGA